MPCQFLYQRFFFYILFLIPFDALLLFRYFVVKFILTNVSWLSFLFYLHFFYSSHHFLVITKFCLCGIYYMSVISLKSFYFLFVGCNKSYIFCAYFDCDRRRCVEMSHKASSVFSSISFLYYYVSCLFQQSSEEEQYNTDKLMEYEIIRLK